MLSKEVSSTIFKVFGMMRLILEAGVSQLRAVLMERVNGRHVMQVHQELIRSNEGLFKFFPWC